MHTITIKELMQLIEEIMTEYSLKEESGIENGDPKEEMKGYGGQQALWDVMEIIKSQFSVNESKKLNEMPRRPDSDETAMNLVADSLAELGIEDYDKIESLLSKYEEEIYMNMPDMENDPGAANRVAEWIINQENGSDIEATERMYSESKFNEIFVRLED